MSTGESGRYLHPDVRRRQIVEAASRVFAEKGFPATRMSDIAAEANIAQGTIYRFFDSKEEIAKAVFEVSEEICRAALQRILRESPDGDAKAILGRYIAWYVRFLARGRRIVAALFAWEVDTNGRSGSDIGWTHWRGEQLGRLLKEAGVEEIEGTDMGRLLPLLIYSLTALSNLHAEDSQEDEEALGRRIIDIVERLFDVEVPKEKGGPKR
ncbi:MAG TPA: TetR/AcrR family transcriptional regulator [Acidimicrobiales bacterium]|nr:TetR/AcrR family transcriptional regulator [Acidimicrobiales bacterium]